MQSFWKASSYLEFTVVFIYICEIPAKILVIGQIFILAFVSVADFWISESSTLLACRIYLFQLDPYLVQPYYLRKIFSLRNSGCFSCSIFEQCAFMFRLVECLDEHFKSPFMKKNQSVTKLSLNIYSFGPNGLIWSCLMKVLINWQNRPANRGIFRASKNTGKKVLDI